MINIYIKKKINIKFCYESIPLKQRAHSVYALHIKVLIFDIKIIIFSRYSTRFIHICLSNIFSSCTTNALGAFENKYIVPEFSSRSSWMSAWESRH